MKKTLLTLSTVCLLMACSHISIAQTWNWIGNFGGTSSNNSVTDLVADNQGNVYITGTYSNTIQTPIDTIVSAGGQDMFIAKFDSTGTLLWLRGAGGVTDDDNPEGIDIDANGNAFITGSFRGSITFDNISTNSGGGVHAVFLAKYDTNGNVQWVRRGINNNSFVTFIGDRAYDVKVDNAGNVYITGEKSAVMNFGSLNVSNPNGFSIGSFLVKFDTNGNPIFGIPINPSNVSYRPAKLQIANNSVYVLYINFPNGPDLSVKQYSLTGSLQNTFTSFAVSNILNTSQEFDFVVDDNGNMTVAGEFQNNITINNNVLTPSGGTASKDIFVTQRNANGTFQWVKQFGGGANDKEGGISIDTSNNLYISGYFNNAISIDTTVLQSSGQDVFVAKLGSNGDLIWARTGGSGNTLSNSISVNENGDVFIGGQFSGTAQFDNNQVISSGSGDALVAKLGCEPQAVSEVIGDTVVCIGTTIYQAINNSSGDNFIWSISGGGTLTNSGNLATVNWTQTGIYTITVAQINECGSGETFSFDVTVKDVPSLPVINGDNSDCLGSSTYNVTNNFQSDTYNWTLSGGGNLFPLGNTAIVNWAVTGTHTLNVAASNLCGTSPTGSLTIGISEIPIQPSPITGNANVCQGTQTYTVSSVSNVDYTWSLSSGGFYYF